MMALFLGMILNTIPGFTKMPYEKLQYLADQLMRLQKQGQATPKKLDLGQAPPWKQTWQDINHPAAPCQWSRSEEVSRQQEGLITDDTALKAVKEPSGRSQGIAKAAVE